MTYPRPLAPTPTLRAQGAVDPDLAADLLRDLGADTLFFICAVEAALAVHVDESDESPQLPAPRFDEAA